VCVKTLQRHRSPRIPWGFGSKISGGTTLSRAQVRTQIRRARIGKRGQRLRPLSLVNSPKAGKKVRKLRREHNNRRIGQRGRDLDRWFLRPGSIRRGTHKGYCGPSDVHIDTHQPSDRTGGA
jgi:hypothetical protein